MDKAYMLYSRLRLRFSNYKSIHVHRANARLPQQPEQVQLPVSGLFEVEVVVMQGICDQTDLETILIFLYVLPVCSPCAIFFSIRCSVAGIKSLSPF